MARVPFIGDVFKWQGDIAKAVERGHAKADAEGYTPEFRQILVGFEIEFACLIQSGGVRPKC